jgi:hypothetical protein
MVRLALFSALLLLVAACDEDETSTYNLAACEELRELYEAEVATCEDTYCDSWNCGFCLGRSDGLFDALKITCEDEWWRE